jgi:S1-C subfamily serine protease
MSDDVSRRRFLGLAGAATTAALAGCAVSTSEETDEPGDSDFNLGSPDGTDDTSTASVSGERFAEVFREARDAVVQVRVRTATSGGSGTGWVVDDGHIVTNEHVVEGAERVFVRFRSSGWIEADIVGEDVYSDLAVLSVEDQPDATEPLALRTTDPAVGTEVLAIGNPFGLSGSVSSGIVSGVNRTLPAPNNFSIPDAIQTDAPVNPGNSGGPLVNLDGDVVGVINSGGGDNIGFAISGALTDRVVPALVEDGEYNHPYLGIRLDEVTPALAQGNGLDVARGIYVHEVVPGTPAEGVLEGSTGSTTVYDQRVPTGGDVIKRMDGTLISTQQALSSFLALETSPGQEIDIEIIRDGERRTVQLTIGERPAP